MTLVPQIVQLEAHSYKLCDFIPHAASVLMFHYHVRYSHSHIPQLPTNNQCKGMGLDHII